MKILYIWKILYIRKILYIYIYMEDTLHMEGTEDIMSTLQEEWYKGNRKKSTKKTNLNIYN